MAKRADDFHHREQQLSEIVADYFDAAEQAEKTRATARTKAEKIRAQADQRIAALYAQAEAAASDHEHRAHKAISRMLELGETPRAIADTLGVPIGRIRETQRPETKPARQKRR